MKDIKKRGLLVITALVLLIGMAVFFTYAWYTRISSIAALDFHLAHWDFNANFHTSSILVNVYEYTHIYSSANLELAAPGTAGTVTVRLGADDTETDVEYIMTVDTSTLSPDFQKRLYFFYYDSNNERVDFDSAEDGLSGTIEAHSSAITSFHWEWIYSLDEYLERTDPKRAKAFEILNPIYETELGPMFTADQVITLYNERSSAITDSSAFKFETYYNDVETNSSATLYGLIDALTPAQKILFFKVMDDPDRAPGEDNDPLAALASDVPFTIKETEYGSALDFINRYKNEAGLSTYQHFFELYQIESDAWDDFDTKVGDNPDYYKSEMAAEIYVFGAQIKPELIASS